MTRRLLAVLDLAACLLAAAVVYAITHGGFSVEIAGLRLSARAATAPAVQLAAVLVVRLVLSGRSGRGWSPVAGFADRWRQGQALVSQVARSRALPAAVGLLIVSAALTLAAAPRTGLTGRYYTTAAGNGAPFLVVRDPEPSLARMQPDWFDTDYSITWTGVLSIARPGHYRFGLESDDGATLWIDGDLVVDNGGVHSPIRAEGTRVLEAGFHRIEVRYSQTTGGAALRSWWSAESVPGERGGERRFAEARLFPDTPGAGAFLLFRVVDTAGRVLTLAVLTLAAFLCFAGLDALVTGRTTARPRRPDLSLLAIWAARRRRTVAAVLGTFVVATVVVHVGSSLGRGVTGRYFASEDWTGEPFLVARDHRLTRERMIYDFTDPDGLTSVEWSGLVRISEPGEYRFTIRAPGPAGIWIGGALVADRFTSAEGPPVQPVRLGPGFHRFRVRYADHRDRPGSIAIDWTTGAGEPRPLAALELYPAEPARTPLGRAWLRLTDAAATAGRWLIVAVLALAGFTAVRQLHEWRARARPGGHSATSGLTAEAVTHFALLVATGAAYVWASWMPSEAFWGFGKMARVPEIWSPTFLAGLVAVVLWVGVRVGRVQAGLARADVSGRQLAMLAIGSALACWWWRSGFVNADGTTYRWMTPAVLAGEFTRTLDEMWEVQVHAWFWQWTRPLLGWSVRESYQVVSAAAGGVFVAIACAYARRLFGARALLFTALLLGGGYIQLFFGDVEHYTLVAVILLGYYLAAERFLAGAWPLAVPAAALALAMTFHLLAGFVLPSLLVLYVIAYRRRGLMDPVIATVAALAVIVATFLVLDRPLASIWHDGLGAHAIRRLAGAALSAGAPEGAGAAAQHWAFFRFDQYHWDQYNLLALLLPGHLVLLPLVAWRRVKLDPVNVHLLAAAAGMLFYHFNYRALFPIDHDWNLFANAAVPMAILVWRNLLLIRDLPWSGVIVTGWLVVSWLPTLAWVVSNHRYAP